MMHLNLMQSTSKKNDGGNKKKVKQLKANTLYKKKQPKWLLLFCVLDTKW